MIVKLLTEQHLEFLSLNMCPHLSKCHIVGNHMSRLNYYVVYPHGRYCLVEFSNKPFDLFCFNLDLVI